MDTSQGDGNEAPGVYELTTVRQATGSGATVYPTPVTVAPEAPVPYRQKRTTEAYILGIPLGWLGAHHCYLRRPAWGCLYLFTLGLLGIGWVSDWFRMPWLVKEANKRSGYRAMRDKRLLSDAYVLWFPFGLIGFHHFYLRRYGWGVAYLFTLGFLGLGWLIDGIRMPALVRDANNRAKSVQSPVPPQFPKHNLGDAYVLTVFPLTGLLGGQHYYLDRVEIGIVYTLTLGLLGIGYLVDWLRMPCLVSDLNKMSSRDRLSGRKRLDDAYLMLFPFGFLGLHHFYLRRYCWGMCYLFTFGCFGIGWLIDFVRLPWLVNDYNKWLDSPANRAVPPAQVMVVAVPVSPGYSATTVYTGGTAYPGVTAPMPAPPYTQTAMVYPSPAQYPQAMFGVQPPSYEDSFPPQAGAAFTSPPVAPPDVQFEKCKEYHQSGI